MIPLLRSIAITISNILNLTIWKVRELIIADLITYQSTDYLSFRKEISYEQILLHHKFV